MTCTDVDAYPLLSVVPVPDDRLPMPLETLKFIATLFWGTPMFSTRTVSGTSIVAPWATHLVGAIAAKSSADAVPTRVACFDCGGVYEAGARVAVMLLVPVAMGVTLVEATPASSLNAEQFEAPPQTERIAPLVVDHPTVAPLTGVTPSADTTRTRIGLAASAPTAVDGSAPCRRTSRSVAAAP